MKIVTQVGIIFSICWISQIIESLLPFSFPASVIGMILLLLLLAFRVLKVDHIREKSDFLLSNMAFFFIPAGVSIINYFDVLKTQVFQIITICAVSTVITFAVTVYSMKLVLWLMKRNGQGGKASQQPEDSFAVRPAKEHGRNF